MNLHKICLKCGDYFPANPMEFSFYCEKEECQKSSFYRITQIKLTRHIPTDYFDLYDLDRSIIYKNGNKEYERVCRVCGNPLFNKNGEYSYHKRYCNEHNGYELWAKYNWGLVSKNYAREIAAKNKGSISEKLIEHIQANHSDYKENPRRIKRDLQYLTICELCSKLCLIYDYSWHEKKKFGMINVHHKIPVHTLDKNNLHLIWDESNLIALCEECHHKQDHQLKTKVDPFIQFRKITEFIKGVEEN